MGVLYTTVKISQESKKQIIIQELLALGITDYNGEDLNNLDYYSLRQILATEKARKE